MLEIAIVSSIFVDIISLKWHRLGFIMKVFFEIFQGKG